MDEFGPDFPSWLERGVDDVAATFRVGRDRAFPAWWLSFGFGIEIDDAFNKTETLAQGDMGIDGWHLSEDDTLHIIQAKWSDEVQGKTYSRDQLDGIIGGVQQLLNDSKTVLKQPGRERFVDLIELLHTCEANGFAISIDFLVRGQVSDNAKSELERLAAGIRTVNGEIRVEASFIGLRELHDAWITDEGYDDLVGRQVRIKLAQSSHNLNYELDCEGLNGISRAAVCTLDARSLGDVHRLVGPSLFHSNVRFHLGKNKINKGMEKTLRDPDSRNSFWLYNNGITIVCNGFEFAECEDGDGSELRLIGPQIVNGAQTTVTLSSLAGIVPPGEAAVQARVIKFSEDDEGREQVASIVQFTNSQSVVRLADLRSNDLTQVRIARAFDSLEPGWFYERKRGEWRTLTRASQARYRKVGSGYRIVKNEDVGTRMMAALGSPAKAVRDKESIWVEPNVFDPTRPAAVYLLVWKIYSWFEADLKNPRPAHPLWMTKMINSDHTYLEKVLRARKLAIMHLTAMTWYALSERFGDLARNRSEELLKRLEAFENDQTESTFGPIITNFVFGPFFAALMNEGDSDFKHMFQQEQFLAELLQRQQLAFVSAVPGIPEGWKGSIPNISPRG